MQVFMDMQQKMAVQPNGATPEAWSQFLTMQGPMMQTVMTSYLDQTKNAFEQMQEQMQRSSEQMLAAMLLKR
jgi:polyhydroxyalkanoate synthesis regulator protein